MNTTTDSQREYVNGLRDLADFLENHPDFISESSTFDACLFVYDRETFAAIGKALGGERRKRHLGQYYEVARLFGPHQLSVNIPRDKVCRQVVVGERVIPAQEERTEEIVEWVCDEPVILGREPVA